MTHTPMSDTLKTSSPRAVPAFPTNRSVLASPARPGLTAGASGARAQDEDESNAMAKAYPTIDVPEGP